MTKEEIVRMAREAGFADSEGVVHAAYQLERFFKAAYAAGAAAEREACAMVAEQRSEPGTAAFIRERGNT
jgi:hypothetical protein